MLSYGLLHLRRGRLVRVLLPIVVAVLLAACGGADDAALSPETTMPTAPAAAATTPPEPTAAPNQSEAAAGIQPGEPVPADIVATAVAVHGEGGVYVANLPRPADVPAEWLMDRAPQYEARSPRPGEKFRFACEDLPARSIGAASVGYRSLEGLPSVSIEYVIYPSAEDAAAALADMRAAAERCGPFEALAGVAAQIQPIPFPELGEGSFAAELASDSEATGSLLTHVVKVRQGPVIIGVNLSANGAEGPPDQAISAALARLALVYVQRTD